jgi:hypothetical protein
MPEIRTPSKREYGRNNRPRRLKQNSHEGGMPSRLKQALEKRLETLSSIDCDSDEYQTVNLYDLEAFTRQLQADQRKRQCVAFCRALGALTCTVVLVLLALYLGAFLNSDKRATRHYNMSLPITTADTPMVEEKSYILVEEQGGEQHPLTTCEIDLNYNSSFLHLLRTVQVDDDLQVPHCREEVRRR